MQDYGEDTRDYEDTRREGSAENEELLAVYVHKHTNHNKTTVDWRMSTRKRPVVRKKEQQHTTLTSFMQDIETFSCPREMSLRIWNENRELKQAQFLKNGRKTGVNIS